MVIKPEDMQGEIYPIRVDYGAVEYEPEGLTLGCARWLVYGSTDAPRWVRYFPPGQEPVVTVAHDYDLFNEEMTLARPEGFECEHAIMLPWPGMLVQWDRCEVARDMIKGWQWTECSKFWDEVHRQELELDKQWEANAKAGILPYEYIKDDDDDSLPALPEEVRPEHARLFETWMELRRRPASFWRPKDCGLTYGEGKWAAKGTTDEPHWVHYYSPETNFRLTGFAFDDDEDDTVWIWPPHEQPESPMCHEPILAKWKDCVIAYELLSWTAFLNLLETRMDYEDEAP